MQKLFWSIVFIFLAATTFAVSPHPDVLDAVAKGEISAPYFMQHISELRAKGICIGSKHPPNLTLQNTQFKILCLLVDFSDNQAQVAPEFFDTLLFGSDGHTLKTYYMETSYGQFDIVTMDLPSSIGWTRAPHPYSYYVDDSLGLGTYPMNSQGLYEDLIKEVDSFIDFSNYDNDGNSWVEGIIIVHAGRGAEVTLLDTDIWSHKWSWPTVTNDGVITESYTIQPEYGRFPNDMTIGVFAHEFAHLLGLEDLYDLDGSSQGIGDWGLMGSGSWNGSPLESFAGGSPAHFSAYSRLKLGWTNVINILSNSLNHPIEMVAVSGEIYKLWTNGESTDEYFLVENRQRYGYDGYLPGVGILIWHIDESMENNTHEWRPGIDSNGHYRVALEQADGRYELEYPFTGLEAGDSADPFPGKNYNTNFNGSTSPTSDSYIGAPSFVGVNNISYTDSIMYADLIVGVVTDINDPEELLPISITLHQNYPNPFNPTTSISYEVTTNSFVDLQIYNINGQIVKTLVNSRKSLGLHTVKWDGTDDSNDNVSSGVYFYRLQNSGVIASKSMILLR